MTPEEIYAFLNANEMCYLATAQDNVPYVRGMMHAGIGPDGFYFHTGKAKDMTAQLQANPRAEVCVFNPQEQVQVRVAGDVEFVDDIEIKKKLIAARPFLQPIIDQVGFDGFVVFRLVNNTATVWTMATNMAPKTFVSI
jgi:uncharacterized pyridoxamine 5'-phosphate oxidase family protein